MDREDLLNGVGSGIKKSRPSAELEKIRVELRQKRNFMVEQRRTLEYLEKGGDPLDFSHEDLLHLVSNPLH